VAPGAIRALGNLDVLRHSPLAFFCSSRCPGDVVLKALDGARALRDAGRTVISGFHSSMERDCLDFLLKGTQPVIICPARGLPTRLPAEWREAISAGRLLLLTAFGDEVKRATAVTAAKRNAFVAALATEVLVAHASPGAKLEQLCRRVADWGKPLWTFDSPNNDHLLEIGAQAKTVDEIVSYSRDMRDRTRGN